MKRIRSFIAFWLLYARRMNRTARSFFGGPAWKPYALFLGFMATIALAFSLPRPRGPQVFSDGQMHGFAAPFTTPSQIKYNANVTGSVSRPISSKEGDIVSVCDRIGAVCPSGGDDTTAFTNAIAQAGNGTVYIPRGTYAIAGPLVCTGGTKLKGEGTDRNDPVATGTILSFTNAGDGLQLGGNCTAEDLSIVTTNASAGTGLRLSGLVQRVANVTVGRTGSGLWSKCVQGLGPVTTELDNVYTQATACTTGIDLVPNGSNAVGNFNMMNCETRSTTTGLHLGGNPGALSVSIFGGAIENNGSAGILADGAGAPSLAIYGTHFEQNTTDDIKWTASGDLSIFEANFVAATTNAINCPNTTCTARLRIYGAIGNATTGAVIIGDSIGISSIFGSKFRGAAFTVNKSSNLMRWGNTNFDGTAIQNFVVDDGSGYAQLNFAGGAGTNQLTIQSSVSGIAQWIYNGNAIFQTDGSGKIKIVNGISADGGGEKHKRFGASCTTGGAAGNTCTTTFSWTTALADANYTPVCMCEGPTGSPILTLSATQIAASVTVQVQAATAAASSCANVYCWAGHD